VKLWKIALLVLTLVALTGAAFTVAMIRRGFSAREAPSTVEKIAALTARQMAIPSAYAGLHNPVAATGENLQAGLIHFSDHCATCHANDGSGDTMFGKGLYPPPPDMRLPATQSQSDGELYYTIENGVRLSGMPAFGEERFPGGDNDTWKLVLFLRHMQKLSADELTEMKRLNPKTEEDRQEEQQEELFLNGEDPPVKSVK